MSTSSSTALAGATANDVFWQPPDMISGEPFDSSSSISNITQAFPFSSGNARIEETRGDMLLYRDDVVSASPSSLPVARKPLVCVLGVPNHMTFADFYQFCGSFIQHILEMRIVRNDGMEHRYIILIRFDDQESTDNFYKHFKGTGFLSLEAEVCCVLFTVDVQYTGSIEHAPATTASSAEQPTCPVCLERLDQDTSGILTTICNHSFHCSCISNGQISLILYVDIVSSSLKNRFVLFAKLLRISGCLLFVDMLDEGDVKEENEREISSAVEKALALRLQKMQAKLDRCLKEKSILDDPNENLLKNKEIWTEKIIQIEEREKKALKLKDDKIRDLEEQLRDRMAYLEAGKTTEAPSVSNEIKDGIVLSSRSGSKATNSRRRS